MCTISWLNVATHANQHQNLVNKLILIFSLICVQELSVCRTRSGPVGAFVFCVTFNPGRNFHSGEAKLFLTAMLGEYCSDVQPRWYKLQLRITSFALKCQIFSGPIKNYDQQQLLNEVRNVIKGLLLYIGRSIYVQLFTLKILFWLSFLTAHLRVWKSKIW